MKKNQKILKSETMLLGILELLQIVFVHGNLTFELDTEVIYKELTPYAPDHYRGIAWNDPTLAIDWGDVKSTVLPAKDKIQPLLSEIGLTD